MNQHYKTMGAKIKVAIVIIAVLLVIYVVYNYSPSTDVAESKLEKETSGLIEVLSSCELSPSQISVQEGSMLTFRNRDSIEHIVGIFTWGIAISAGEKKTVTAHFKMGPGVYSIKCDSKQEAGFVEIKPQS